MKEFWDERFGGEEYFYGKKPNTFFAEQLQKLEPGKLLLPAEGEGRNAVYAAKLGWEVTAFDYSISGQKKALGLAAEHNVTIDYKILEAINFNPSETYDAIALIFTHFEGEERRVLFEKLQHCLSPGGHLIMEVFSKKQLGKESGGPPVIELLYSADEIRTLFPEISFTMLTETTITLDEGGSHQGEAEVVRAVGMKK